jgi:hypothetical protein
MAAVNTVATPTINKIANLVANDQVYVNLKVKIISSEVIEVGKDVKHKVR